MFALRVVQNNTWKRELKGMDVFIQSPFFYTKMSDTKKIISVDAMGGDHAPDAVLGGMNQFLYQYG